jgi:hypothetical protein
MVVLGIRVERIILCANPTYTIESARLRAMPEWWLSEESICRALVGPRVAFVFDLIRGAQDWLLASGLLDPNQTCTAEGTSLKATWPRALDGGANAPAIGLAFGTALH